MTRSGPQRSAIGNGEANMVATTTRRLGDQLSRAPSGVLGQSKASTRPAISPTTDPPAYSELSGNDIDPRQHPVRAQDLTTRGPGPSVLTRRRPDWFPFSRSLPPLSVPGALR